MTGSHTSYVNSVLRINANQMATVSDDLLLNVWNINTSSVVNTYRGHTSKVQGVVVMPNGYLATYGSDQTIRVWDVQNQLLVTTVANLPNTVNELKWSASTGLFVINIVNSLAMFDPTTFAVTNNKTTSKTYNGIDILQPSGMLIAVGANYLDIYTLPSFTLNFNLTSSPGFTRVKLLSDNQTVVLGLCNGSLALFDSSTNTLGDMLSAHTTGQWVLMLALTPDQLHVISGAQDSKIIMWTWSTMSMSQVKSSVSSATLNSGAVVSGTYNGRKLFMIKLKHRVRTTYSGFFIKKKV
jgi:WD40 repeat protein